MRILFVSLVTLMSMFLAALAEQPVNPLAIDKLKAGIPEAKDIINYDTVRHVLSPENALSIIIPGGDSYGRAFSGFIVLNEQTMPNIESKDREKLASIVIIGTGLVKDAMKQSFARAELSDDTVATAKAIYNNYSGDPTIQVIEKYKLKDEFPEKFKEVQKIKEKRENNAALLPFTYNNGVTKFWYPPELEAATREALIIKSSVDAIDRQLAELKKLEEEELKDEKPILDKLDELSAKKKDLEAKISEEQTKHSDEINAAEAAKTTAEATLNATKQKLASITGNTAIAKRNRTAAEGEVSADTSKLNSALVTLAKAKESFAKLEEELTSVIDEIEKLLGDEKIKYKRMRKEEFKKKRESIVNALLNIKSGSPVLAAT